MKNNLEILFARLDERSEERHKVLLEKLELINKWQYNHEIADNQFREQTNNNFAEFKGLSKKVNFIYTLLGGFIVKMYYAWKGGA